MESLAKSLSDFIGRDLVFIVSGGTVILSFYIVFSKIFRWIYP